MEIKGKVLLVKEEDRQGEDFGSGSTDKGEDLSSGSTSVKLKMCLQLVSATIADKHGRGIKARWWAVIHTLVQEGETMLDVQLPWDHEYGIPGALVAVNYSNFPVYLKSLTIESFLSEGSIHFMCNGWVYPVGKHEYRLFFTNNAYTWENTPSPLLKYRDDELLLLRGELGAAEPYKEWDRVYDYAFYNDLGDPDQDKDQYGRPVLGGSAEYPYPRRGKTGQAPTKTDPYSESRVPLNQESYVPCDERAAHILQKGSQKLVNPGHFKSLGDIFDLYMSIETSTSPTDDLSLLKMIKKIITEGIRPGKYLKPHSMQEDDNAWHTDEEFAREMLAGANSMLIRRLHEFPQNSKLYRSMYGKLDIDEALVEERLFILDYHDLVMPYLNRINKLRCLIQAKEDHVRMIYATRALLYRQVDDTLKPLAIELSLPHPNGEHHEAVSDVYTPRDARAWELAKAHVTVNNIGIHQLISHWLNTHAVMEPFVIATNRQLSVLHPIYKLLSPHFYNTMKINAAARQYLVSAVQIKDGRLYPGIIEAAMFPGKYSMEMSSRAYKTWKFTDQALPTDLIKRGMAERKIGKPEELDLLIKDYPYAVDGLDIWNAIKAWVEDYCKLYYSADTMFKADKELVEWWNEVRYVGHGDLQNEPWWPKIGSFKELTEVCTTIIWVASALHAVVHCGQHDYDTFQLHWSSLSCPPMPKHGSEQYEKLMEDEGCAFLETLSLSPQPEALVLMATFMLLSMKSTQEECQQSTQEWTKDEKALEAFARYKDALRAIEEKIKERNNDPSLSNRNGRANVPYTSLMPSSIPNSISV